MKKQPKRKSQNNVILGEDYESIIAQGLRATKIRAKRSFSAYAAPSIWGPWVTVASHIGSVTFTIETTPLGDTLLMSRVRYWKGAGGGSQVTEEFRDSTTITTSNSVANVEVSCKGVPTGSAVDGSVEP